VRSAFGIRAREDLGAASKGRRGAVRCAPAACLLAGCLILLALVPGLASAAVGHKFLSRITEAPTGTPLSEPQGIAVNRATGELFVTDSGTLEVDVFDAAGNFKTQFVTARHQVPVAVAVDEATGYVYVVETETSAAEGDQVDVFKPVAGKYELLAEWTGAKTSAGRFGEIGGVAVDNSKGASAGDVYIVDSTAGAVDVYTPPGPIGAESELRGTQLTGGFFEEPNGIAVNAENGKVYVLDAALGYLEVFGPTGAFELKVKGKGAPNGAFEEGESLRGITVDPLTGDIYVSEIRELAAGEQGLVEQFSPAGVFVGTVNAGEGGESLLGPRGLAVAAGGQLDLAETDRSGVDVFGPESILPDVVTGKATIGKGELSRTTAVIHGTINPLGKAATYRFEYGENEEFTTSIPVPNASAGEGTVPLAVEASLTGLKPGTEYVYRLVGENENGTNFGFVGVNKGEPGFKTEEAVEGVATGPAENRTTESAELTGFLEPNGIDAHYYFEYGTTPAYGSTAPAPPGTDAGVGGKKVVVTAKQPISGLKPNTLYHFRIVASNEPFGTTAGSDETFTTEGVPRITPLPVSSLTHNGATLHSLVNPGGLATTYDYEFGETTSYGQSTPEEETPASFIQKPAQATLTGLHLATTYHYRLVAKNSVGTTTGPDEEFTTVLIDSVGVSELTGETAQLQAQINPLGLDTKYRFEYGTTESYGATTPVPDGDLGSGTGDVAATAHLSGLTPDTTYHYRVVATVETLGSAASADRTFVTHHAEASPPPSLADGRGYEMVSPVEKHGASIQPIPSTWGLIQASEDGNAITYAPTSPISEETEGNRAPEPQQVLATRGSSAWASQDIATAHSSATGLGSKSAPEYRLFSSDLSLSLVEPYASGLTPLAEPPLSPPVVPGETQEKTIYLRANAPIVPGAAEAASYQQASENGATMHNPGFLPLISGGNTPPNTHFGGVLQEFENVQGTKYKILSAGLEFMSATPDLGHVVLQSEHHVALTSEPILPNSSRNLYEWSGGHLKLVNVLPNGQPGGAGAAVLGFGLATLSDRDMRHAISNDGSRVIWTDNPDETTPFAHLYQRDMVTGQTVQIDAVQGGPVPGPEEPGAAEFQTASEDGTRVFFTDKQRLTADSNEAPGRADLYMYDVTSGKLTDLTVDANAGEGAGVQRLLPGASEDGSYVYLVATGVLAPGAKSNANNLYVLHEAGGIWTTTFIAALAPQDGNDWALASSIVPFLTHLTSRVSPNGHFLAFMSNRPLTKYDNTDANTGLPDQEAFIYDALANKITCVSCDPSGARPVGAFAGEAGEPGSGKLLVDRPGLWRGQWLAGSIPGWTAESADTAQHQSRYLADSGRMFFTSPDNLVPAAANGKEDIYEYEPNGIGSCQSTNGCVTLLSSGSAEKESAFIDASVTGNDVFMLTASRLVPTLDDDGSYDIYDARVCTEGSPCLTPPPPSTATPCATTETCHGSAPPVPSYTAPASQSVSGSGNIAQTQVLGSKTGTTPVVKPLTRAQKYARALKKCHKLPKKTHSQKHKRAACEAQAKKQFGPKKAKSHKKAKKSARFSGSAK
jgi:hypothetical protein